VPSLDNAEIGCVEAGFAWPASEAEEEGLIEIVEVTRECLVSIKECDKMNELSDQQILDIFKKYAISKLVRFP
jgi:hypothetical protein